MQTINDYTIENHFFLYNILGNQALKSQRFTPACAQGQTYWVQVVNLHMISCYTDRDICSHKDVGIIIRS